MMNIKKRNLMVTALGGLMVMGTMLSPLTASASATVTKIIPATPIVEAETINLSLDDTDADFLVISGNNFEDMLKAFDVKPSAEDKKQMKKYFEEAEKLAKDGKFDESEKKWEKFDKILKKYVDFSDSNIISINAVEIEPSSVNQSTTGEAKILSDKEVKNLMLDIEKSINLNLK